MKTFRRHQLNLIQEAIVSIMWTKKEVMGFLEDCGVPSSMLTSIEFAGPENFTKRQLLEGVFTSLLAQPNKGTPEFINMADQLTEWQSFNPRWFEVDQTLDRKRAESAINALRTAIGKNEIYPLHSQAQREATTAKPDLTALKQQYLDMADSKNNNMSPQARGFAFETFLNDLFSESGISPVRSFRVHGMQIDGSFKYENHHYLLEAKWRHSSESAESVFVFAHKVSSNMDGRGLFISNNGFTELSILTLMSGGVRNVILMDGSDLFAVLDERISLGRCLDEKIRAAQTRGDIYYDPVQARSKSTISVRAEN